MRRTREEAEVTKQKILDAGLAVFSRKGYKSARVEDIAKQANVTTGAIYHHFDGKSALYIALVEKSSERTNQLAGQIIGEGGTPAILLRRLLVRLFEFIEEDQEYRAVVEMFLNKAELSAELSIITEQANEGRRQLAQYFSDLIKTGVEVGEFRPSVSPEDAAIALVGFMNGMGWIWLQDPNFFSIKRRAEKLVDSFLSGIVIRS